jgi:lipopolysaccharide transport system ATP-binding protein
MSDAIITVENLSKKYLVGHNSGSRSRSNYIALRDVVGREIRNFARKTADVVRGRQVVLGDEVEEFWALKDVSFEVKQGEVLGIIGGNGAGKSTLLKVLSRITEPTRGRVVLRGRVASLLEVGTGFHPELTGRENIFLNGAILGMTRGEIKRKFDEIVAFAEVEKFLDTPLKRYSSGMYVRLAFAVAAHLELEIMVVDEVLAVGDTAFQRKCLGKMSELVGHNRTVVFVSHNLGAVRSLCTRSIMLSGGRLASIGETAAVIGEYLEAEVAQTSIPLADRMDRTGNGTARFHSISIENANGEGAITTGCRIRVVLEYSSRTPLMNATFLVAIYDMGGTGIYLLDSDAADGLPQRLPARGRIACTTAPMMATPGRCFVNLALLKGGVTEDWIQYVMTFEIHQGETRSSRIPGRDWMMCMINQDWTQIQENASLIMDTSGQVGHRHDFQLQTRK